MFLRHPDCLLQRYDEDFEDYDDFQQLNTMRLRQQIFIPGLCISYVFPKKYQK